MNPPKPPAGPWVQEVRVCGGPAAHVLTYAFYPDATCFCLSVFTPYANVSSEPITIITRVDGVTTVTPIPFPTSGNSTPYPTCVYTNDPSYPYPCLLVSP